MMKINEGEEIAMICVSQLIHETGYYKFLAKRKVDNKYEWVHFVERIDKIKENVYKGVVKNEEELKMVMDIMNRNLMKIFGPEAEMKIGKAEYHSVHGKLKEGEA